MRLEVPNEDTGEGNGRYKTLVGPADCDSTRDFRLGFTFDSLWLMVTFFVTEGDLLLVEVGGLRARTAGEGLDEGLFDEEKLLLLLLLIRL